MNTKLSPILIALLLFTTSLSYAKDSIKVTKKEINKGWTFKQVRGNNWYPAQVPGVVHTDLIANKLIEDPFYRLNERKVQWVDKEDWEYKTTLHISNQLYNKKNIELHFKGLDTYADVYVNDSCLLKANNMFREWTIDIKPYIKAGNNQLRIYFHSPIKMAMPLYKHRPYDVEASNDQSENGGIFDNKLSVFTRKAGYHYGWDWGPRLVTSGIWRPIYLVAWNDARIENIQYIQHSVTAKRAEIEAVAEILADKTGEITLTISIPSIKKEFTKTVCVKKGKQLIKTSFTIQKPQLWWSNGLGKAHLYSFTASIRTQQQQIDKQTQKIGLRSLRVINKPDKAGHSFYFELNGIPVFAKGANYIPQDVFLPRVSHQDNLRTILAAVHANMNMLRVWGGGVYESDDFYSLCDEYGILIFQDFMFACSTYPMDKAMLENIRCEAIDNVKRLRNHPCIAIWAGNNEMHSAWFNWGWIQKYKAKGTLDRMRKDYKDVFHETLPAVIKSYNPGVFYWPSSPYGGEPDKSCDMPDPILNPDGDSHYWGVWHGKDSIANYNNVRSRFFSEYGFQSFPEYQSILKYAPEDGDHNIYSEVMMAHQRGGKRANSLIEWYLHHEYRIPKDFQSLIYMGQLLQGDAIKTAIEAHRRDMPFCMGSLFWQHNDCWPVASWSSRDYYGRWKAQHYFAKKAYKNLLISPIQKNGTLQIYIVSDFLKAHKGCLEVSVLHLNGTILSTHRKQIKTPINGSKICAQFSIRRLLQNNQSNEVVIRARFTDKKDQQVYSSNYFLTKYKEINFPKVTISTTIKKAKDGFDITLTSDVFARGVFLNTEGIDYFFSDNYFDLFPSEPITLHVTTPLKQKEFEKQLKIRTLSDAY